jgi:hypothetical protein
MVLDGTGGGKGCPRVSKGIVYVIVVNGVLFFAVICLTHLTFLILLFVFFLG